MASYDMEHGREGEGSLSGEELYIDKHVYETAFESPNATAVGKPDDRQKKRIGTDDDRLHQLNEERHRALKGHSNRMHELDKKRITEALCSALDVSNGEQRLVVKHLQELDFDQFGNQKAVEKVSLAVIRYVVDQQRLEHGAEWDDLVRNSDAYTDVRERVLDGDRGFMKLCEKVKSAVEEQRFRAMTGFSDVPGPDPNLQNTGRRR
ncbi:hypothetical protein [Natronorubrum sp. FCH18a]|uniref:hypothetical protein n=1 Tax=Natronorubrum sp. FCH18a TaxID=3447018 RepID=UPI003F50FA8A